MFWWSFILVLIKNRNGLENGNTLVLLFVYSSLVSLSLALELVESIKMKNYTTIGVILT